MLHLPPALSGYRLATDLEVRSWSYGAVKALRRADSTGWQQCRFTLDDQAIFGPLREFECACSKYRGPAHRNMICDRCGVKVTTPDVRRSRFGHIDLPMPVSHPLGTDDDLISVPVLPAVFWESSAGGRLAPFYENLVAAAGSSNRADMSASLAAIVNELLPAVVFAHEWSLADSSLFARGLALVPQNDVGT
jgi:hypothetical protein